MSTPSPEERADHLRKEIVELARQFFNGPRRYPQTNVKIINTFREKLVALDIAEASRG
jgi:hypothetical protein